MFPLHEHGAPKFTEDEVAYLEGLGLHLDRHHGLAVHANGIGVAPGVLSSMLAQARQEGVLRDDEGGCPNTKMAASKPTIGSPGGMGGFTGAPPVVHLDLRGGWPGPV